ncbi:hypothetical protein F511_00828 [Dorcoceras hygrometricum]|nr:hypothetical protein F511_00828 [Dorcoceras hygrometricum]
MSQLSTDQFYTDQLNTDQFDRDQLSTDQFSTDQFCTDPTSNQIAQNSSDRRTAHIVKTHNGIAQTQKLRSQQNSSEHRITRQNSSDYIRTDQIAAEQIRSTTHIRSAWSNQYGQTSKIKPAHSNPIRLNFQIDQKC